MLFHNVLCMHKDTKKHKNGNKTLLFLLLDYVYMPSCMQIGKIVSQCGKIIQYYVI